MKAQREQFERTARAEEALAESQERLANEPQEANRLARRAEYVNRCNMLAAIGAQANELLIEESRLSGEASRGRMAKLHAKRARLQAAMRDEAALIRALDDRLTKDDEELLSANDVEKDPA